VQRRYYLFYSILNKQGREILAVLTVPLHIYPSRGPAQRTGQLSQGTARSPMQILGGFSPVTLPRLSCFSARWQTSYTHAQNSIISVYRLEELEKLSIIYQRVSHSSIIFCFKEKHARVI